MRIFVSHSESDSEFAGLLVDLLEKALSLRGDDILCTSVDGHRLPGGQSTDERLRSDTQDAELMIGLITPNSMRSMYVGFELGARWGSQKTLIPAFALGVSRRDWRGPRITELDCSNVSQVYQLVEEVANHLSIVANSPSLYANEVNLLVQASVEWTDTADNSQPVPQGPSISSDATTLLTDAVEDAENGLGAIVKTKTLGGTFIQTNGKNFGEADDRRSIARWEAAIEELLRVGYLEDPTGRDSLFQVTHQGFEFIGSLPGSVP